MMRVIALFFLLFARVAAAEPAWVSDQFEVMLRSGPSTNNAIERMLPSGTAVEVLERDAETGYSRVRMASGADGWVLTRYLLDEPTARQQLETLTRQLTSATTGDGSLSSQLLAINGEYEKAMRLIESLEGDKQRLQQELAEVRRSAADVLAINDQNKLLRDRLAAAELNVASLEQHSRDLSSQTTRYWFLTGALVLLVGMMLGIWFPRIRWQRRSRYDRF